MKTNVAKIIEAKPKPQTDPKLELALAKVSADAERDPVPEGGE
jgi:hypothetical protein